MRSSPVKTAQEHHHRSEAEQPEVSVVMPCLNEEKSIAACVQQAQQGLAGAGIRGEVVVVDNMSDDRSAEIAAGLGARVVYQPERGYGNAYVKGFQEAQGKYIVMGDSDGTYDFSLIPRFIALLNQGYDLVMGSRIAGDIKPGAMPWLHRYLGVPILTYLLNMLSGARVSDAHCGMRAFTREALQRIYLNTGGMEFASEMIIEAARARLKIAEVPITYLPREGDSKLHTFRDGWRHLRFMFVYSPTHLFLVPGGILTIIGLLLLLSQLGGSIRIAGVLIDIHSMILGSVLIILGFQILALGLYGRIYAQAEGIMPQDRAMAKLKRCFSLERGLVIGSLVLLSGLGLGAYIIYQWFAGEPGLNGATQIRPAVGAMTLMVLGVQLISSSFFLSLLALQRR